MSNIEPQCPTKHELIRSSQHYKEVRAGFYQHLSLFLVVGAMLILIYLLTGPIGGYYDYPWFIWPLGIWGIGLTFHLLIAFVLDPLNSSSGAEKRLLVRELRKLRILKNNSMHDLASHAYIYRTGKDE